MSTFKFPQSSWSEGSGTLRRSNVVASWGRCGSQLLCGNLVGGSPIEAPVYINIYICKPIDFSACVKDGVSYLHKAQQATISTETRSRVIIINRPRHISFLVSGTVGGKRSRPNSSTTMYRSRGIVQVLSNNLQSRRQTGKRHNSTVSYYYY